MHIGPSESHFSKRRQIHLHIHCRCQNQIRQVHKNQIPYKQQCFAIRLVRLHLHLHFLSMQTSLLCTIRDKYISHSHFFSARNTSKVQVFYRNAYIWFPKVNLLTSPPWLVHRLFQLSFPEVVYSGVWYIIIHPYAPFLPSWDPSVAPSSAPFSGRLASTASRNLAAHQIHQSIRSWDTLHGIVATWQRYYLHLFFTEADDSSRFSVNDADFSH